MSETTAAAVAALRVAYPRQEFPDESVRLYVRMLADLDGAAVSAAVERLIRRSEWLPSIAEIRRDVAEATCALPTPAEAWTMVIDGASVYEMPDPVRESLAAVGGRFTVLHSERPLVVHAQFLADYQQRRDVALAEAAGARAVTSAARAALAALPPSAAIQARPVWARWLRRQALARDTYGTDAAITLQPPTDAEKHDAILVLRDVAAFPNDPLHQEAQRIMDEASAA